MPLRRALHAKIHRATVTHADLSYEGSIALPPELIEAANFHEHEAVWLWNVTSGTRLETYIIEGTRGSSNIAVNGAAAHLMKPNDVIIIASFCLLTTEELDTHIPTVVFVDSKNKITEIRREKIPG